MTQQDRIAGALDTIQTALLDLAGIRLEYYQTSDGGILRQQLDRWKRRTVDDVERTVSRDEARRFAKLPLTRTFVGMQDPFTLVQSHEHFLAALGEEIVRYPERYGDAASDTAMLHARIAGGSRRRGEAARVSSPQATPLPYPDRVTLKWLFEHVPPKFWFALVALLVSVFSLGFRLGQSPAAVRVLKWVPGLGS